MSTISAQHRPTHWRAMRWNQSPAQSPRRGGERRTAQLPEPPGLNDAARQDTLGVADDLFGFQLRDVAGAHLEPAGHHLVGMLPELRRRFQFWRPYRSKRTGQVSHFQSPSGCFIVCMMPRSTKLARPALKPFALVGRLKNPRRKSTPALVRFQTIHDFFWLWSEVTEHWTIASVWKVTDDLPQQPPRGSAIRLWQIQIVRVLDILSGTPYDSRR
jgi:hypothetical protein